MTQTGVGMALRQTRLSLHSRWPVLARSTGVVLALCWALYFLLTSTVELTELPSWHDEQRAIQVLLLALTAPAAIYAVCSIDIRLSAATAVSLAAFASLAVLSSSMAALPSHSFAELSLFVGLAGLAVLVASAMSLRPKETWKAISMSCLVLGAAHVVAILTRYGAALSLGDSLGLDVLLLGFANPRFPSALYAVLMPFIAAVAVDRTGQSGTRIAAVATLSLLWMVNIGLGTRAIFFAYLLAGLVYFFAAGKERARVQLGVLAATLGLGAVLYWLLFVAVPSMAGLTTVDIVRDPSSLAGASGRFELWLAGGSFLRDAPLLGIGPMHFAAFPHPYGAHPHSWPIQISAEYGLPAALLLTYLLWRLFRGCRPGVPSHWNGTGGRGSGSVPGMSRRGNLWLGRRKLSDATFSICHGDCLRSAAWLCRHLPRAGTRQSGGTWTYSRDRCNCDCHRLVGVSGQLFLDVVCASAKL